MNLRSRKTTLLITTAIATLATFASVSATTPTAAPGDATQQTVETVPIQHLLEEWFALVANANAAEGSPIGALRQDGETIMMYMDNELRWQVYLAASENQQYAYIVFNCGKVDNIEPALLKKILAFNRLMGLSRFEVSDGMLRINTPCMASSLTPERINQLVRHNLEQARATVHLWGSAGQVTTTDQ